MNLIVSTPPAAEPISTAEIKAHLRIDGSDEDTLLDGYVAAARIQCELEARRAFVTQTLQLRLEAWPTGDRIALPRPPLQSVTSIAYIDSNGAGATMDAGDYIVDANGQPGQIILAYGSTWPSVTLRPGPSITITYVAGYGAAAAVPQTYRQAIQLLAGHYYENREAVTVGQGYTSAILPMAVSSLLMTDRNW